MKIGDKVTIRFKEPYASNNFVFGTADLYEAIYWGPKYFKFEKHGYSNILIPANKAIIERANE